MTYKVRVIFVTNITGKLLDVTLAATGARAVSLRAVDNALSGTTNVIVEASRVVDVATNGTVTFTVASGVLTQVTVFDLSGPVDSFPILASGESMTLAAAFSAANSDAVSAQEARSLRAQAEAEATQVWTRLRDYVRQQREQAIADNERLGQDLTAQLQARMTQYAQALQSSSDSVQQTGRRALEAVEQAQAAGTTAQQQIARAAQSALDELHSAQIPHRITDLEGVNSQVRPPSWDATPNTLVVRDASGRARVADPASSGDAATKNYVDTKFSQVPALPTARQSPTANTLCLRDGAGRVQVGDPASGKDAANRDYVDSRVRASSQTARAFNVVDAGDWPRGVGAPVTGWNADPNTVPVRDANGRLQCEAPNGAKDTANKAYVDSRIQAATSSSSAELRNVQSGIDVVKTGRLVTLVFSDFSYTPGNGVLGTIPEGFRPQAVMIKQLGSAYLNVRPNGTVSLSGTKRLSHECESFQWITSA